MADRKRILLVEDSEEDIRLIRRAFEASGLQTALHVVRDGEEAINYLVGSGEHWLAGSGKYVPREDFAVPELILLDLRMPNLDGFDLLRWIRKHPDLKAIRVIVLTSSENMFDVKKAFEAGANSFLVKPFEFMNYPLHLFWFKEAVAPRIESPAQKSKMPGPIGL